MPICHQYKFIFLHIPKCAGTSVEACFNLFRARNLYGVIRSEGRSITLQHLTLPDLRGANLIDDDTIRRYFKFTIIRDPFDRLASDYQWQRRLDSAGRFSAMSFGDFIDFAQSVVEQGRYFEEQHFDHFRPMVNYCFDGDEMILDDILLLEYLDYEMRRLRPLFGDVAIPHRNDGNTSYDILRTARNEQRVYSLYVADKALFDSLKQSIGRINALFTQVQQLLVGAELLGNHTILPESA